MSDKIIVQSGGPGLCTILLTVFLVLKLTGVIDWSWWWVTAPLWMPFSLLLVFIMFCLCVGGLAYIFRDK
jgi:hypothetical protein